MRRCKTFVHFSNLFFSRSIRRVSGVFGCWHQCPDPQERLTIKLRSLSKARRCACAYLNSCCLFFCSDDRSGHPHIGSCHPKGRYRMEGIKWIVNSGYRLHVLTLKKRRQIQSGNRLNPLSGAPAYQHRLSARHINRHQPDTSNKALGCNV